MRLRPSARIADDWSVERYHVFVPAIMGAGLLFSLVTLVVDALHRRRGAHRSHHVDLSARGSAASVATGQPNPDLSVTLRPRGFYLVIGVATSVAGLWVAIGALVNYARSVDYAGGIAWVLALALLSGGALCWIGAAVLAIFARWPDPPGWTYRFLRAPMTEPRSASRLGGRVPWHRSIEFWLAFGALVGVTIGVAASRAAMRYTDAGLTFVAEGLPSLDFLAALDPFWRVDRAILLVVVVALLTLRCLIFAAVFVTVPLLGALLVAAVQLFVQRPGPLADAMGAGGSSYPNEAMVHATIIAGYLPLAVRIATRRLWLARVAGAIAILLLVATGFRTIQTGAGWPGDVIGGLLLGLTLVLAGRWVLAHRRWHERCHSCPWALREHPSALVLQASRHAAEGRVIVLRVAQLWTVAAVVGFGLLAMIVGIPRDPDGALIDSPIAVPVQLGLLALIATAAVFGRRLAAAAAVVVLLAGLGLGLFAAVQYSPAVAAVVGMIFVVPAVLFWAAWQHTRRRGAVVALAVLTGLLLTGGWYGAVGINERMYGPTHPESATRLLPVDSVEWAWAGAVTADSATVVARLAGDAESARLVARSGSGPTVAGPRVAVTQNRIVRLPVDGLLAATEYEYAVEVDGRPDDARGRGRLRTFPAGPGSFTLAVASCARTGSNGRVFDAIRTKDPDLFLITGDLHYADISENSVQMFDQVYNRVLTAPAQAALYRAVPIAYVWDDHDYGPNNADATSPSRAAAAAAYRQSVPHYPLSSPDRIAVYQSFDIGRVRFIVSDTRSQRTPDSILGARQLEWFDAELRAAARTKALVVWINPDPWIGRDDPGADAWWGYPEERRRLATMIAAVGVPLVMVSGDAHMVAIDDGTNSDYSGGEAGFPVLQAAALDRPGGVKGGPYSEGTFPGGGQFGTLEVIDTGGAEITVRLAGWDWSGRELLSREFKFGVPEWPAARTSGGLEVSRRPGR